MRRGASSTAALATASASDRTAGRGPQRSHQKVLFSMSNAIPSKGHVSRRKRQGTWAPSSSDNFDPPAEHVRETTADLGGNENGESPPHAGSRATSVPAPRSPRAPQATAARSTSRPQSRSPMPAERRSRVSAAARMRAPSAATRGWTAQSLGTGLALFSTGVPVPQGGFRRMRWTQRYPAARAILPASRSSVRSIDLLVQVRGLWKVIAFLQSAKPFETGSSGPSLKTERGPEYML